MKYIFMAATGIALIQCGWALWNDKYKSAAWFFLSAIIFATGMF